MGALQAGEIDWWESPPRDLVEQLARDRDISYLAVCNGHGHPALQPFASALQ
jgi:hypothetical protein